MTNAEHPISQCRHQNGDYMTLSSFSKDDDANEHYVLGLSKREHFASIAMQGMLNNGAMTQAWIITRSPDSIAELAVNQADALIKALNK